MTDSIGSVEAVYTLLAQREFGAAMKAVELAKSAVPEAEGSALLALHEAIVHALDEFLTELGEHGVQNQSLWGIELADVDVPKMVAECAAAWGEVTRLRADGVTSDTLTRPFVGVWMVPVGGREWMNEMRLGVQHRQDPTWSVRVSDRLRSRSN
jgi:hypothetical protein